MTGYKEMAAKAKKAGTAKTLTPELFKFEHEGDTLIGVFVSAAPVAEDQDRGGYNQYVFETDEGIVKVGPGRGFDADCADSLKVGLVYSIEFLGQAKTSRGYNVNKFEVLELGPPEYIEVKPAKPGTSGKTDDTK